MLVYILPRTEHPSVRLVCMYIYRHPQTLKGLMDHSQLPTINTEEAAVEAVNRQLNSNVRQVHTEPPISCTFLP